MKNFTYYVMLIGLLVGGCREEEGPMLPPVEERVEQAKADLLEELLAPAQGWRIDYRPTAGAGNFLILVDFRQDGTAIIRSDVIDDNGAYLEDTIPYRIDVALDLELIFETYGVFHYLFELNQSTFGGEFEFIFERRQGDDLIFSSKTDDIFRTIITMMPADGSEAALFATDLIANFNAFGGDAPQVLGDRSPTQQVVLEDRNISIFWTIDLTRRAVSVDFAAVGTTAEEVIANNQITVINRSSGYSFSGGRLELDSAITINLGGESLIIDGFSLDQFSPTSGPPVCDLNPEGTPRYTATSSSAGSMTLIKSLLSSDGFSFTPLEDNLYGVNAFFIFDDSLRSLQEEGIISRNLPTSNGFIQTYGFKSDTIPEYAIGFILEDTVENTVQWILREYEPTQTQINRFEFNFLDSYYKLGDLPPNAEEKLNEILDEIFEGGEVYIYDFPLFQELTIFWFYNPCNRYEYLMVQ